MWLVVLFIVAVFIAALLCYVTFYHDQPLPAVREQIFSDGVCYVGLACTLFALWAVGITLPGVSPWLGGYITVVFTLVSVILPLRTREWSKQHFVAAPQPKRVTG